MGKTLRRFLSSYGLLALCLVCLSGCFFNQTKQRVVHRDSCLVCHRPLDEAGQPHGIEEAHPYLSCVSCHGGTARSCDGEMGEVEGEPTCSGEWIYDKEIAHVSAGDGPTYLKNLTSYELNEVDPAYLQFVNPGDLRVAYTACGPCHDRITDRVINSTMAHTAGELSVARYRAGVQETSQGIYGAINVTDPNYDPNNPCQSESYELYIPPALEQVEVQEDDLQTLLAKAQDQYMAKSCLRCHLSSFGENRFMGDFRSSGCTSCHMNYEENGLSQSGDPTIEKMAPPHPRKHILTKAPTTETCTHCHYRGSRIGPSFQGYRESARLDLNPSDPGALGRSLHGHDQNYYLRDENLNNDWDETPADVHFEAGMHCIDCHNEVDVHGDGHLYNDTKCAVTVRCEDCHGDARSSAQVEGSAQAIRQESDMIVLDTKVTGLALEVPQVIDSITMGHPRYSDAAAQSMGISANGESHLDEVECSTCHAGWVPTCYGCHVTIDMTKERAYHANGEKTAGAPSAGRSWVSLFDMVLMRNISGKLAPSQPTERFFMTVYDESDTAPNGKAPVVENAPRVFRDVNGHVMPGFGQRTVDPHTTQRRSQFMACDRCHSVGSTTNPTNQILLDMTYGFGTDRYLYDACDITIEGTRCAPGAATITHRMDAIQTRDGTPLVVVGHEGEYVSRPLTLDEIQRMKDILVPDDAPISTEIPEDAATNPFWPGPRLVR